MKISIIGAGNVGSTIANLLVQRGIGHHIVLLDRVEGLAEGKAIDISQGAAVFGCTSEVIGVTDDYEEIENSDIIVFTAGIRRTKDITREALLHSNYEIISDVCKRVINTSPKAILIVVSNPLDIMTSLVSQISRFNRKRVIGMAGILDTSRYVSNLSKILNVDPKSIQTLILGPHNDDMLILPRYTTVSGIPITQLLSSEEIDFVIENTKGGGKQLVDIMGLSGWVGPAASTVKLIEAIVGDQKMLCTVSVMLKGEYDINDVCLGVPAIIDKNGVDKIIEIDLEEEEKNILKSSSNKIKELLSKHQTV